MNTIYSSYGIENFYSARNFKHNLRQKQSAADKSLADLILRCREEQNYQNKNKTAGHNLFKAHPRNLTEDEVLLTDSIQDVFKGKQRLINNYHRPTVRNEDVDVNLEDITILPTYYNQNSKKVDKSKKITTINKKSVTSVESEIKLNEKRVDKPKKDMKKDEKRGTVQVKNAKEQKSTQNLCNSTKHIIFGEKFNTVLPKINSVIQNINQVISKGNYAPIEDSEDYLKRQKRAAEFTSRLSRNYLYQISRQIVTLREDTNNTSVKKLTNLPMVAAVGQHFASAFQLVFKALNFYHTFIPVTIDSTVHKKCQEIFTYLTTICEIFKEYTNIQKITAFEAIINEIEDNSKKIEEVIKDTIITNLGFKTRKKVNTIKKDDSRAKNVPFHRQYPLEERLSMYISPVMKKAKKPEKKSASAVNKQRFTTIRQKCLVEEKVSPIEIPPCIKSSSHVLQSHRSVRLNEDDIETMVERHAKRKEKRLAKEEEGLHEPKHEFRKRTPSVSQSFYMEIKSKMVDEPQNGIYGDVLNNRHRLHKSHNGFKIEKQDKANQSSHITVTGTRNAKLYCIKHKSCFESESSSGNESEKAEKFVRSCGYKNKNRNEIWGNVRALDKNYLKSLVNYKLEFHEYMKNNFMYTKKANFCKLGNRVSDILIDELLRDIIIQETNLDEIPRRIYVSEFI